jgi:hypothetical protein
LGTIIAILALLVASDSTCKKPIDEKNVIGDKTKLPEQNTNLVGVVARGDTLVFAYKHGAAKPSFEPQRRNGDNHRFSARTAPDKTAIERQIAATDKQIDQLVYELYGLTEEEIRIMEGDSR